MKNLFYFILFYSPIFLEAQPTIHSSGIQFERELSWSQIKEKARREDRYIFVDCYATWCGPCKWMDSEIFKRDSVGSFYNAHFLNVKLQFDSTRNDDETVMEWFSVARQFEKEIGIKGYPTYLFFNANGKLVDKITGITNTADLFIKKGFAALDTNQQYYILRDKFLKGERTQGLILSLVPLAILHGDFAIAYKGHNLFYDMIEDPYLKDNLKVICASISKSNDKGFQLLITGSDKVNSILGDKDRAQSIVKNILSLEAYQKYIKPQKGQVKWDQASRFLEKKAPNLAGSILLQMQITDAYQHKAWDIWGKRSIDYYDKYSASLSHNECWFMNNILMDIFRKCNNKNTLQRAAKWSKKTIGMYEKGVEDATCVDTYANLLYKCGNKVQALCWEQKAIELSLIQHEVDKEEIQDNFQKMQKGIPTWPDNVK